MGVCSSFLPARAHLRKTYAKHNSARHCFIAVVDPICMFSSIFLNGTSTDKYPVAEVAMTFLCALKSSPLCRTTTQVLSRTQTRPVSSSPYGRTHVWKRRPKTLPNPCVPTFPQLVVRADGATYTHHITSPRSTIRLTRDTTTHPLWNASSMGNAEGDEGEVTGRLGRFNRRFEGLGGSGGDVQWMEGVDGEERLTQEQIEEMKKGVWGSAKAGGVAGGGKKSGPGSGRRK